MLNFILGFYDPVYTSNGLTKAEWSQMLHDMGAAAFKIWLWFHS